MTTDSAYEWARVSALPRVHAVSGSGAGVMPGSGLDPNWLADASTRWMELTLEQIPVWQTRVSDAYLRWSVTDRALCASRCDAAMMAGTYEVTGLRPGAKNFERTPLVAWSPQTAVERHDAALSSAMRLAMREMVDEIERSALQAFEILLLKGPHSVLERPTERGLKRIYQRRAENPDGWAKSWSTFMVNWRRSQTQSDASKLVSWYWSDAQLFMAGGYDRDALQQVNAFVAVLQAVRDHISEGHGRAQPRLARLSAGVDSPDFSFDEGAALEITRGQLELVEAFYAEYLRMLTMSLKQKSTAAPMPV
ncbi:hypothetical protein RAZWK3B_08536 [Roseobacter sp. AzwK-3b]|uniref:hypothetical protein n=1 Tax=Roseobacter sp. AzwK-3b TaxID=351016 RepID=UPI00015691DE|nr:hypothetical protein [Roseobacter sp. AzwK-3b]EDM72283.1 hypothetical protein RAZWK3B_08536 [Roseobacter sp. AzwK-3b]